MSNILEAKFVAFDIIKAVERRRAFAHILLRSRLSSLPLEVHSSTTELVYGTLRRQNTLDWYVSHYVDIDRLPLELKIILRIATYQLLYHRIPKPLVVNEAVEMAKILSSRKSGGLVNAVLRKIAVTNSQPDTLSVIYSHPEWLIEKWSRELGKEETILLCRRNNQPMPTSFRVNQLKTTLEKIEDTLNNKGIRLERGRLSRNCLVLKEGDINPVISLEEEGKVYIQSESSMVVVETIDCKPGMKVIDGCAGYGGKTTYIAELMKNKGTIIAVDRLASKLSILENEALKRGITIINCIESPIERLSLDVIGEADRVLLDVPCSGLGTLSRKPEIKWRINPSSIEKLVLIQRNILKSGKNFVKPGGILVYSACTISKDETYDIIKSFLEENKEFILREERQILPHIDNTEGFYMAKLERKDA
ncbi:MAG: 16S rRNA (cytosine(967)-C(5))-methyltransferase RsmB [bacterium]